MEHKGFASWKIILIIVAVLVIGFGAYLGLAWILRLVNGEINPSDSSQTVSVPAGNFDKTLVGAWESDCLVPQPDNKWAEKHKFVIKADGAATHTRQDWAMNDCTTLQPNGLITDQFKLTAPSSGKINLTYTASSNSRMDASTAAGFTGQTIYDIYKVTGSTLEFGHGFRGDNLSYGSKTGSAESDRFDSLNSFIVYHKK